MESSSDDDIQIDKQVNNIMMNQKTKQNKNDNNMLIMHENDF